MFCKHSFSRYPVLVSVLLFVLGCAGAEMTGASKAPEAQRDRAPRAGDREILRGTMLGGSEAGGPVPRRGNPSGDAPAKSGAKAPRSQGEAGGPDSGAAKRPVTRAGSWRSRDEDQSADPGKDDAASAPSAVGGDEDDPNDDAGVLIQVDFSPESEDKVDAVGADVGVASATVEPVADETLADDGMASVSAAAEQAEVSAGDFNAKPASGACGQAASSINFSVGSQSAPVIEPNHPDVPGGSIWVYYSSGIAIDVAGTSGKLLPITNLHMDDVVIALLPDQTIQFTGGQNINSTIHFPLPANAFVLRDPAGTGGQTEGWLIDAGQRLTPKSFDLPSRQISIPSQPPSRIFLDHLIPQGLPVLAYNEVTLGELKTRGFIDANNILRIKFAMIPHGGGFLTMNLNIPSCLAAQGNPRLASPSVR